MRLRYKAIVSLMLLVTFLCGMVLPVAAISYEPDFEVASEGVYLINLDEDQVFYEKNAREKFIPASLTKIMTAIIALEQVEDLEAMVTAPYYVFDDLIGMNASNAGLWPNERLRMIDLLYALMLASACEAAEIIADYVAGSQEAFVDMMNEKCKEIGALDTHFVDAHGLDDYHQYTTAYDMYLITKYALSIPEFETIATTVHYEMPPTNRHPNGHLISHTNAMLKDNTDYYYEYIQGIKTGTTGLNTKNLVTIGDRNGFHYMCVLLSANVVDENGERIENTYLDTKHLYNWAFDTFKIRTILDTTYYAGEKEVELAADHGVVIGVLQKDISQLMSTDIDLSSIQKIVHWKDNIVAPVKKGEVVGTLELRLKDEVLATENLVAAENVDRSTVLYMWQKIKDFFASFWAKVAIVALGCLIVSYIIFSIWHNKRKKRKHKNYPTASSR